MSTPSLLSLDDALLDAVISKLAATCGVERAVAYTCLINRRFAALVKKPLAAWRAVSVSRRSSDGGGRRRWATAHLARWLASVAPGVETLSVHWCDMASSPTQLAIQPCLASARGLKVRAGAWEQALLIDLPIWIMQLFPGLHVVILAHRDYLQDVKLW